MRTAAAALLLLAACRGPAPSGNSPAETTGAVGWQYVGIDSLEAARADARSAGRLVLVGLSGGDD